MSRADGELYLGIDVGTSGCRVAVIETEGRVVAEQQTPLPAPERVPGGGVQQDPALWWDALTGVLEALLPRIDRQRVRALALDGTSGTVLLADARGRPLGPALMYNDNRAVAQAERIGAVAPPTSAAHGTGSGLAKLVWLLETHGEKEIRVCTQTDWLNEQLTGTWFSDANNSLKSGYDPQAERWPEWLDGLGVPAAALPPVLAPGTPAATLRPELAERWGLQEEVLLAAGTTDSTAAILATGADRPGDGITSLGSTLVTKVIAERPIAAPEYGVYSQPLGDHWLVGGGSNSGGAVLLAYFSREELRRLSRQLDPSRPVCLDYYPLLVPGERFPVNDPNLQPRLHPRPRDERRFLQGLLESIARIELQAYRKLAELGAPYPQRVLSVGGGAGNETWRQIRQRLLGVPLVAPVHADAAYGTALLARKGARTD